MFDASMSGRLGTVPVSAFAFIAGRLKSSFNVPAFKDQQIHCLLHSELLSKLETDFELVTGERVYKIVSLPEGKGTSSSLGGSFNTLLLRSEEEPKWACR